MDIKDLDDAIKERDAETIKKLAAIDLKVDVANKATAALDAQMLAMAQKMIRGEHAGGGNGRAETLGSQFVRSEGFQALAALPDQSRKGRRADMIVKATLTSLTTDAAGSVGAMGQSYVDNAVMLPQRRMRIRDLIPQVEITSGSVEVPVQKLGTRAAGMVAEGALKPASDMQFELKTFVARTIAHHLKASRQILDDVPQLQGMIDSELLYGLMLKEESQLLSGDNSGQSLWGMIPQATAFATPFTMAAPNFIDVVGLAVLKNALAEYPADGIVMHPADWMRIRLIKDLGGNYIFGEFGQAVEPRLFGVPVVPTQAMTIDKFLIGQFQVAATIYDRWDARVEVATENEDDFVKNLVTVLAEERLAFAVKKPLALTYGDFSDAVTAATAE